MESNVIKMWEINLDFSSDKQMLNLKNTYAKWTTNEEFWQFIAIIKNTWLSPFKKEIWCVKYWQSPAQIFIGRDWYRNIAKRHPDYLWHRTEVVCENDTFTVTNWQLIEHTYWNKDRWAIIWWYCIVKIKWRKEDLYHFVDFDEYNTGKSKWA